MIGGGEVTAAAIIILISEFSWGYEMYLYLGQDMVVQKSEVLGVFDLDNTTYSGITRKFLSRADKEGRVVDVSGELPKSFVLCCGKGRKAKEGTVYLSQLASATLLKRWDLSVSGQQSKGGEA